MSALAFFKAGKLDHELAVTGVIVFVIIMGYLVVRGMKGND